MFGRTKGRNRKTKVSRATYEALAQIKRAEGVREVGKFLEVPQSAFGQFSWGLVDQVCRDYGLTLRITHENVDEPTDPVYAVTVRKARRERKVAQRAAVGIMSKLGFRS